MRIRKPNPKYAIVALIEDNGVKESSIDEEAAQSKEQVQVMDEELKALKQNETWELITACGSKTHL